MLMCIQSQQNQPMTYGYAEANFYALFVNSLPIWERFQADSRAYFQWMIHMGLIEYDNNCFKLTNKGMDFLKYIQDEIHNVNLKLL